LNGFQLKRAHFDREHIEWFFLTRHFRKRFADIAASDRSLPACIQHLGEQFGCRRFAIRTGNGDDWNFAGSPPELEFTHYVNLAGGKIARESRGRIDAWTYNSHLIRG
jgi:hypothetical protein